MKLPSLFRRKALAPVDQNRGWVTIFESYSGAWQENHVVSFGSVAANPYLFACMTLIARDIAKLQPRLMKRGASRIWEVTQNPAFSPVLRKPNAYQTRAAFVEAWLLSKLSRGNAYILKVRDQRNVVVAMHVLNPDRVTPLVSDDGEVFYNIATDNLAGLKQQITVPAREIIHDRWNTLFHPLVGISPVFAAGMAATQGMNIQSNSASFFANQARPSGILTAPGKISTETAARLKETWTDGSTGTNFGKIMVAGDGLEFRAMSPTAEDSQVVDQLKWTASAIAAAFHVPLYKIGAAEVPTAGNVQTLNLEYYSQCLQSLIEDIEACLDEGLGLDGETLGVEFDIDNLLRMDAKTMMETLGEGVKSGIVAPDEARQKVNLGPVEGGATPYMQQQNYSLAALAKRDAKDDPWDTGSQEPPAPAPAQPDPSDQTSLPPEAAKALWREKLREKAA